jgi:large subunit ribosomal protein L17
MRHKQKGKSFNRPKKQREALLKSLARSLILSGKIETTQTKAKELRPYIEKLVSRAREAGHSDMRVLESQLEEKKIVMRLVKVIAPKYKERPGGYTRIVKLPLKGSATGPHAIIEFV